MGCVAVAGKDDVLPSCVPTVACNAEPLLQAPPPGRATILFVLDANASNLRFYFGRAVRKAYASQLSLLVRSVLSLRRVNTTLPIHALVSGERVPSVEERLQQLGVRILGPEQAPPVRIPPWASKWARASFAKVRALALAPAGFGRVIVLDTDTIVLRNIDHLASFPSPAFVVGYKCFPRRELRAALMVLQPSRADWERASALMADPSAGVYDDLGEGSVWRRLYERVHELPAGYAALRSTDLDAAEWAKVHVLHDPNLLRKAARAGWRDARMAERLKPIDELQAAELRDHITPLLQAASPPVSKKAQRRHVLTLRPWRPCV